LPDLTSGLPNRPSESTLRPGPPLQKQAMFPADAMTRAVRTHAGGPISEIDEAATTKDVGAPRSRVRLEGRGQVQGQHRRAKRRRP